MSHIFFDDTYVAVLPTYEATNLHKHSMLHVFVGNGPLMMEHNVKGNLIILEQNVTHRRPAGDLLFFLFVDPTSAFASRLRSDFLKGNAYYAADINLEQIDLTEKGIKGFVKETFGDSCFIRRDGIDERIISLLEIIDRYEHLESKVSQIAEQMNYSESYITHLFKQETGVSLKGYLLLRQVEFVWKGIIAGESITEVALKAGFSSPSHFSDTCKKLTGISVTEALK